MSLDFTAILSGEFLNPVEVLIKIEQQMSHLGFRKIPPIYRVELDTERGVFDETDNDEISKFNTINEIKEPIQDWQGHSLNFQSKDFGFYLLIGTIESKFINCYIDITERTLRKLLEQQTISKYYAILGAIGACCQAKGGYGALELPFAPISPNQIINAIWENPEYPDIPSSMGLIPEVKQEAALKTKLKNPFTLSYKTAGFWIVTEKDDLF